MLRNIAAALGAAGVARAQEDRTAALKMALRVKEAEAVAAAELETLRLQQTFKTIEREAKEQRALELRTQQELWSLELEAKVAAKQAKVNAEAQAKAQEQRAKARLEKAKALRAYEVDLRQHWEGITRAEVLALRARALEDLESSRQAYEDERKRVESERLAAFRALEAEVASLLERLKAKSNEHALQTQAHRTTLVLMHAALALEDGDWDRQQYDDVPQLLVAGLPAKIPTVAQLEDRYARVEPAVAEWLLLPADLDTGIFAHFLASLFALAGFSTPPKALSDRQDPKPMANLHEATRALHRHGDLAACVKHLDALPAPNPAQDWLRDAKTRLQADQAAKFLRAKVALVNDAQT